jgi:hypothetical protein
MFNLIWQLAKTKAISIFTKVDLKSILNQTEKVIDKTNIKNKGVINEVKTKREPKWQRAFPFSFFYGGSKFQPLYFWIFVFCSLSACMLGVKVYAAWRAIKSGSYSSDYISTSDLATVLAFISSLILLYNNNKKSYIQSTEKKVEEEKEAN